MKKLNKILESQYQNYTKYKKNYLRKLHQTLEIDQK